MNWIRNELSFYGGGWLVFILAMLAIGFAITQAGCSRDSHTREWRDDPTSIQDEHWLHRYVLIDEYEAELKVEWEAANPPVDWYDAATR